MFWVTKSNYKQDMALLNETIKKLQDEIKDLKGYTRIQTKPVPSTVCWMSKEAYDREYNACFTSVRSVVTMLLNRLGLRLDVSPATPQVVNLVGEENIQISGTDGAK